MNTWGKGRRLAILAASTLGLVPLAVVSAPPSQATGPCGSGCLPHPVFHVIDVTTEVGALKALGEVASCTNAGGRCTITRETSKTTTLEVDLGAEKSWAAGQLSVSLSATSATSVSCTSPVLQRGDVYVAYPRGVHKSYRIKRDAVTYPPSPEATSGVLNSREPYPNSIACMVE